MFFFPLYLFCIHTSRPVGLDLIAVNHTNNSTSIKCPREPVGFNDMAMEWYFYIGYGTNKSFTATTVSIIFSFYEENVIIYAQLNTVGAFLE